MLKFFAEKMWVAFAKATHIFPAKNIRLLCIESTKTVNKMTLNKLIKLTTLWITGSRPRCGILLLSGGMLQFLQLSVTNTLTDERSISITHFYHFPKLYYKIITCSAIHKCSRQHFEIVLIFEEKKYDFTFHVNHLPSMKCRLLFPEKMIKIN